MRDPTAGSTRRSSRSCGPAERILSASRPSSTNTSASLLFSSYCLEYIYFTRCRELCRSPTGRRNSGTSLPIFLNPATAVATHCSFLLPDDVAVRGNRLLLRLPVAFWSDWEKVASRTQPFLSYSFSLRPYQLPLSPSL